MLTRGSSFCIRGRTLWTGYLQRTPSQAANKRDVSTLNPARLTPADVIDLSTKVSYTRYSNRLQLRYIIRGTKGLVPFPDGTHGFLYFVPGPAHAPLAGEVRFRITPGTDPAHFAEGRDLLLPNGLVPWAIPLVVISSGRNGAFGHLHDVLTHGDQALGAELVASLHRQSIRRLHRGTPIIHSMGQPFVQDLSNFNMYIWVTSGNTMFEHVELKLPVGLDAGLIRCCLEAGSHKGRQGVALRVLEIIRPVVVNGTHRSSRVSTLVAGELLKTASGDMYAPLLHESDRRSTSLRALLLTATVPADSYIVRGSPRDRLKAELAEDARVLRTIRNFAPAQLTVTDWVDASLQVHPQLHVIDEVLGTHCLIGGYLNYSPSRAGVVAAFPPGTTGFFYVHVPEPEHPVGAHLRFRLVPTPDPAAFGAGHDLRTPAGTVWQRWLPSLIRHAGGNVVAAIVARQGLVSRTVVERWQSGDDTLETAKSTSNMVCPGSEPFVWDLVKDKLPMIMLGAGARACPARVRSPFAFQTQDQTWVTAFEGQIIVKMEEDHQEQTYAVRVIEVTNLRVSSTHRPHRISIPEPGSLVRLGSGRRLYAMAQKMRKVQDHDYSVST